MKSHRFLTLAVATGVLSTVALVGSVPAGAADTHVARGASQSVAGHALHPRTTGFVTHTYTVNTTSDDTLWSGAPAHKCEDTTNHLRCSFRAAVQVANNDSGSSGIWDVVKVPAGDYKLDPSVSGSSPYLGAEYEDLTIDGAGPGKTVIDGSSLSFDRELLVIDDYYDTVQLNGLTFKGGYADYGGDIYEWEYDSLTTSNCSFLNSDATYDGGAVYVYAYSAFTATSSTFSGDSAYYDGGAIYDDTTEQLTLSNDTFSNNTVTESSGEYDGGAVYTSGDVEVDHSTFSYNGTAGDGGAIFVDGNGVFSYDTFTDNHSNDYYGGAIFASNSLTLTNSKLTGNTASDGGGAIYDNEAGTYADDDFSSNSTAASGGDIFDDDDASISNSTFSKSSAQTNGGSIYVNSGYALTMANDTLTGSSAHGAGSEDGGGAIYLNDALANLTNVTIKATTALTSSEGGGGIFCYDCELTFTGGSITDAKAYYAGGAIYSYEDGYINVDNATISGNSAEWGGGITIDDASYLIVNNSTIDSNDSTYYWGGGISAEYGSTAQVNNSTIAFNKALGSEGWGGGVAIYADGTNEQSTGDFNNDTISNNQAEYGGGLYGNGSYISVNYSTIAYNSVPYSSGYGGGMYNNDTAFFTTGSIWADNVHGQCGGTEFWSSGGDNLDSDNTCGLTGTGDLVNRSTPDLGVLANNGGPTETISPLSDSPAMGNGGSACPVTDQRGVAVASGQPCDIGAIFVEKTTTTVSASKTKITKGHEQAESFTITVTPSVKGMKPAGSATILHGSTDLCTATLHPVPGSKAVAYRGSCTLSPSQLKAGSYSLVALYNASGVLGSSQSKSTTVKVSG